MDSYEQCRGPPRLFLLDKFDVSGAGACLKRYTDPAVYKVEASTYEIERSGKQRDKKIRQTKNKGIRWNGGETPYVTQTSHVNRLHQLFLEEPVQNVVTEPVHCVKLKQRSKRSPFDSESGESYMKKILNSPLEDRSVHEALVCSYPLTLPSDTSSKSRIETPENNRMGSALGSAVQSISPCVSSSLETTICEGSTDKLQKTEIQFVDEQIDHKTLFNTHTGPYEVKHTSQHAVEENNQVESIHLQDLQSSPKTCSIPAFERPPAVESLQASSHDSRLIDHVKHQPALIKLKIMPPPPPKKWWSRIPPTDGGKPNVGLKVGWDSILDEIRSLHTKNKNSQNGVGSFSMLSPESYSHTKDHDSLSVSSEGMITQAALETEYSCSLHTQGHDTQSVSAEAMVLQTEVEKEQSCSIPVTCERVVFCPSSDPSSLPPIVEKLSNNIPPMLPSTSIEDPQVVDHSTLDDITSLNAENQKSQCGLGSFSQMSSPVSRLHRDDPNDSYVSPEATVPQAAVETEHFCIITATSDQEVFQPYPSPVVDKITSKFPPVFPSTPTDDSQAVGQSKLDEKPQHGVGCFSLLSSPGSNIHTNNHENSPVSPEETVPQAAVETEQSYSLSASVDEKPAKSPPVFPSTPKEDLHVVAQSTVDVIRYLDTENKKSFSHKSSPKSSVHTEKHGKTSVAAKAALAENLMPQISAPITYGQENLSPSSNRYAVQRPRTPLTDAVSPHDKNKLKKVSDQATNQIPKGEAHDNILDQIRAKSFKLKPVVETTPTSIRGPLTNLRVAAMIEKANAIRQAFVGSDDDSDGWSD
ncbi:hypothetical protein CTI12_AA531800 [Artemisia annua]|uniref:Protein SCAR n=1 Tax=Artemisia annua TaxID=35608 RepID=A0A2U1L4C6_ARTAN|nr:hypothetical protein CTI12_AA531800 [Artemisia annua]